MEFTEEERKKLEEKYREQRRAMWSGKRPSSTAQEENSETLSENATSTDELPQGPTSRARLDSNRSRTKPLAENQLTTVSSRASEGASEQTRSKAKGNSREIRGKRVSANDYGDTQQMIQKIRSQREEIWEGNSASRTRQRRRWRGTTGKVGRFWNPPRQEDVETSHRWKLALGVLGAIAALVSVGILLGYWFAS